MSGYKALIKTSIKNNFNVPVTRGENTLSFTYGFTPKLTYHDLTAGSRGRLVLSISENIEDLVNNSTNSSIPSGGTDESGSSPSPGQSQTGNSTNPTQTETDSTQTETDSTKNATNSTTNDPTSPHPPNSTNSSQTGRIKVVNPSTYKPKRYTLSEDLMCYCFMLVIAWVAVLS